jgi:hypothetical protein
LSDAGNAFSVLAQSDTTKLMEEVVRYLAAVDLFRELACEPTWRPELPPSAPERPDTAVVTTPVLDAGLH